MDMQTVGDVPLGNLHDDEYDAYLARFQARFRANVTLTAGARPLFTTDVDPVAMFDTYLYHLPEDQWQYHTCSACRNFIKEFGGLVTISPEGVTKSAMWDLEDTPDLYKGSIRGMLTRIARAKVTGVFLSSERTWGLPETGIWKHFALVPPPALVYTETTLTAGQKMAERREDFLTMRDALDEFHVSLVQQAVRILSSDALYRSEKVLGQAQWLLRLHLAQKAARTDRRSIANVLWDFVATAPAGFCHPKSSMIGTLLEDLAKGMDFGTVSDRWAKKMAPLSYQRPQAPPSAGTIERAEQIIFHMKAAGALNRRFARLDDLRTVWEPKPVPPQPNVKAGVFSHLKTKESIADAVNPITLPAQTMTWVKFRDTVLPTAEFMLFYASGTANYAALMTAADPDAPPILQWDTDEQRNPVSWYVWHGGSTPDQFGLAPRAWHRVQALTLKPPMWYGSNSHQGEGVILVLEGAHDMRREGGIGLFPEILKAEFHGIRSVLEAYSKTATMAETGGEPAAGLMLQKGVQWSNVLVRVTSQGQTSDYKLDRWD